MSRYFVFYYNSLLHKVSTSWSSSCVSHSNAFLKDRQEAIGKKRKTITSSVVWKVSSRDCVRSTRWVGKKLCTQKTLLLSQQIVLKLSLSRSQHRVEKIIVVIIVGHRPTSSHHSIRISIIRTATAFCRAQSYPPDDLRRACVVVMRSDASTSPDGDSHGTRRRDSSSAADTDSLDCPNCCSLTTTEKSMLEK